MIDLSAALVTTLIGMMGVVIGAIISNYINQKIARQAVKKDIIFKKKIEYFEKIVNVIGSNTQMYKNFIKKAEKSNSKKALQEILHDLKKNRKKFEMMASPLYLDARPISKKIKQFTNIEKIIFINFEKMNQPNYAKSDIVHAIKINFADLTKVGNNIILGLREDLIKE